MQLLKKVVSYQWPLGMSTVTFTFISHHFRKKHNLCFSKWPLALTGSLVGCLKLTFGSISYHFGPKHNFLFSQNGHQWPCWTFPEFLVLTSMWPFQTAWPSLTIQCPYFSPNITVQKVEFKLKGNRAPYLLVWLLVM